MAPPLKHLAKVSVAQKHNVPGIKLQMTPRDQQMEQEETGPTTSTEEDVKIPPSILTAFVDDQL